MGKNAPWRFEPYSPRDSEDSEKEKLKERKSGEDREREKFWRGRTEETRQVERKRKKQKIRLGGELLDGMGVISWA
eukprot:1365395-Amorphochlora_amoeboformis.AAC.1